MWAAVVSLLFGVGLKLLCFVVCVLQTGRRGKEAEEEIQAMIKDLQLEDKTDWKAEALSGGMKRKLRSVRI